MQEIEKNTQKVLQHHIEVEEPNTRFEKFKLFFELRRIYFLEIRDEFQNDHEN